MQHLTESAAMLKVHMYQTPENNQSTQPPTYSDAAAASLTQAPITEPALDPDFFAAHESHTTPDNFILPGRKTTSYLPPYMIPREKCSLIKLAGSLLTQHLDMPTRW